MSVSSVSLAGNPALTSVLGTVGVAGNQALGKDDFLKLLATQLQYQNPLDPLKDSDFVAQLAQFSNLEGIQQLNTSISNMLLLQQMTQGANLIGKTITYQRADSPLTARGIVASVQVNAGTLALVVDGKQVSLNQVRGIEPTPGQKN
jgi:flagellar basal-body rod modification protein FlgD